MSKLFPSAKNTQVDFLGLNSDDVAPAVATLTNYPSFLGFSNNFKDSETYSNSSTEMYGSAPISVSGYPSRTWGGDIFVYIEAQSVTTVAVTTPGSGYTSAPTVGFTGGGGTGATAIAIINTAGAVSRIWVTNGGTGYTSAPTVTFTGGAGTGAAATAAINQYIDAQLYAMKQCDILAVRTSPYGTTAASKKPYFYGNIALTTFSFEFPSNGLAKISLAGNGSGTVLRGEW